MEVIERACDLCTRTMSSDHAWWWGPHGVYCGERCARLHQLMIDKESRDRDGQT